MNSKFGTYNLRIVVIKDFTVNLGKLAPQKDPVTKKDEKR